MQNNMKNCKILLLLAAITVATAMTAAPKWKDKGAKAVHELSNSRLFLKFYPQA